MIVKEKKALTIYNIEYEMRDSNTGELVTWKANILAHGEADDAIRLITANTKKQINVLTISNVAIIDGVTDKALAYIARAPR